MAMMSKISNKVLTPVWIVLTTFFLCSPGYGEQSRLHFFPKSKPVVGRLIPLAQPADFACVAPATPAKMTVSYDLKLYSSSAGWFREDVARFFRPVQKHEPKKARVVVRRGGKVEPQQDGDTGTGTAFTRSYSFKKLIRASGMSLNATFLLCDYKGFPELERFDVVLAGGIGDFSIQQQRTYGPNDQVEMAMSYHGQDWTPKDGGRFISLKDFFFQKTSSKVGVLDFDLFLDAVPLNLKWGDEQIRADLWIASNIDVHGPEAKQ